jgi:WD40 repeat protein
VFRLLPFALVLLPWAIAWGDPAPKARTDADGLPLPNGAVARLGSARFRFDGWPYSPPVFSPDSKQVAVGSSAEISVFDVATGRRLHRLAFADKHHPRVVRFLADGKRLAVGSGDWGQAAELTIWDLAGEKVLTTSKFTGSKSQIFVVDVNADGSRALIEDRFAKIFLWDVAARREVWATEHKEASFTLPFTADGKHFVVSGFQTIELYDAATGRVVGPYPNPGPQFRQRYSPGLAPDGRIALGSDKGDSVAILAAMGKDRVRLLAAEGTAGQFTFSPDGRFLAASVALAGAHVWDLTAADDKGPVARLQSTHSGAFSPDGKTLALADEGLLTLWSVGDWKRLPASADPPSPVFRVAFSADGKQVVGYTRQGWVAWPAAGGPPKRLSDDSLIRGEGEADVSADGRTGLDVLVKPGPGDFGGENTLRLTDLTTGKDRRIPFEYSGWTMPRISPDGKFVMSYAGMKSEYLVWDATTGEVLHRRKSAPREVLFGAMAAPDGKGLARSVVGIFNQGNGLPGGGPSYSSVTVYHHRAGREWKMEPMPWTIYSQGATFSRDGTRVVVHGTSDEKSQHNCVTVWDTTTGRRLMEWDRESGHLASVTLAADNRSLLAGTNTGTLAWIEVATGGERATFQHRGQVRSSAFDPTGTRAVSSSPDGPVFVWDLLGAPTPWDAANSDAVWTDLAATDAKAAFAAIRKLRTSPAEAVIFLRERVKLPAAPSDQRLAQWLKDLDAPRFPTREQAQRDLTAAIDLIRPKLEAARKTASEEAGRRLDQVLKAADGLTPDKLRHIRACEVLEGIGTPEAVAVLKTWATGLPGARLTVEAMESVGRQSEK